MSAPSKAAPRFADIDHPSFPKWMLEGLDRLFALEPDVGRVSFDLWATAHYDDSTSVDTRGSASFTFTTPVSEERLDEIPPVRMFERRAVELWRFVPLQADDEDGSVSGDYEFYAERGVLTFTHENNTGGMEPRFVIEARHDGERWKTDDRVHVPYEGCASDLLAGDVREIVSEYEAGDLELKTMPEVLSLEIDENDDLVMHLKAGELTRCMETR